MNKYFQLLAVLGLVFPWFFKWQLREFFYWVIASGYLALLISTVVPPREKYWWWMSFEHLAFCVGGCLIAIPIFLPVNRILGFVLVGLGAFVVMFFGYSARMRLIGRPDPGMNLFLELKDKIAVRHLKKGLK